MDRNVLCSFMELVDFASADMIVSLIIITSFSE